MATILNRQEPTAPTPEPKGTPIVPEYPLDVRPRYGYQQSALRPVAELFDRSRDAYSKRLTSFRQHLPRLARIPAHPTTHVDPYWANNWFTGLDAVALYSLLAERNPKIFLEVGSGTSTRFARRAIRDHDLRTCIVSIDPAPRWDVSQVSDEIIRKPFQDVVAGDLPSLDEDDIFFFDGTHYVFSNTDTTVALLETLPNAQRGTLLHFHDVFLPWDYPPDWMDRHYNEQFVLAAYLMSDSLVETILPVQYCVRDPELYSILQPLWWVLERQGAATNGQSLWLARR